MKKQAKKGFCAALALSLLAVLLLSFASCGNGYDASSMIYIGASGPLTGEAATYGVSVQKGAALAVEQINAAGGLNGIKFFFNMLDDQATATQASTNYDSLMDAGMQVSIGAVTTDSCKAFAEKAVKDNLFYITPSASAAEVIAGKPNGYRVCFSDPQQGEIAADYIAEHDYSEVKVGVIYNTDDAYSKGIYEAFAARMAEKQISVNARPFDNDHKTDFSAQVEALKDCDVIFLPMYYGEATLIASKAADKGCNAVLFGSDGFDGLADVLADKVKNKIQYITPFDADSTEDNVKRFVAAYKEKYGETPNQFAADGYDAIMAIFEALKSAGVNSATLSATELCQKIAGVLSSDDFELNGVTGKMSWDADGVPTKAPLVKEIKR